MRYIYYLAVGYAVPKHNKGVTYKGFRIGIHTPDHRNFARESFDAANIYDAILWGIFEILHHAHTKGYRVIYIAPPGWSHNKINDIAVKAGWYARVYGLRFYIKGGNNSCTDVVFHSEADAVMREKFSRFVR